MSDALAGAAASLRSFLALLPPFWLCIRDSLSSGNYTSPVLLFGVMAASEIK